MENKNIKIDLNNDVNYILETLEKANFEAYVVGGFVRDFLLGKKSNDVDITTNALPKEIKSLFPKTIDTGIKHGTITVILNKTSYEVTTFRIDGEYLDSRHPKEVTFTRSLKEDLRRRDFTINAFAYNNKVGLVDYFNGLDDLKNKIIRAIDDPNKRFKEDALRILRCFRFSAQLDFKIEENTLKAASLLAPLIQNISKERIRDELTKILMSNHPEVLILASKNGVTKYFLSEFDLMLETKQETPYHSFDVGRHTIEAIKYSPKDLIIRLTLLFHDVGKPITKTYGDNGIARFYNHAIESEKIAKNILERLRFPSKIIETVTFLILHHSDEIMPKPKYVRRAIGKISPELFPYYLEVQRCDVLAQSDYKKEEVLAKNKIIHDYYDEFMKEQDCFSLKDLKVNGNDLLSLGFKGKNIGIILNNMLNKVVDEPKLNNKEYLLEHINDFIKERK